MRTILFALALLIFTASAHAAGPAPKAAECKDRTAQIDSHQVTVTSRTSSDPPGCIVTEEWKKDGKLDRVGGPAEITYNTTTGIVTDEAWYRDGKLDRAGGPAEIGRDPQAGNVTLEHWWKDGKQIDVGSLADDRTSTSQPRTTADNRNNIIGIGRSTCASYVEVVQSNPQETKSQFAVWAYGFLSGMNVAKYPEIKDFSSIIGHDNDVYDNVVNGVNVYCDKHPLETLDAVLVTIYYRLPSTPPQAAAK